MTTPQSPGTWTNIVTNVDTVPTFVDGDRLCLITVGDGSTARTGYVWQSTTKRADGLHEHIYRRNDGK